MSTNMDHIERLTYRRARIASVMGALFIATKGYRIINDRVIQSGAARSVDYVQFLASTFWLATLLVFLLFGGGLWRSKSVRAMLNDEGTEENRRRAIVSGFWMAMAGAAFCYIHTFFEPVETREAIHLIVTLAVGGTLLRFGFLERQALKA